MYSQELNPALPESCLHCPPFFSSNLILPMIQSPMGLRSLVPSFLRHEAVTCSHNYSKHDTYSFILHFPADVKVESRVYWGFFFPKHSPHVFLAWPGRTQVFTSHASPPEEKGMLCKPSLASHEVRPPVVSDCSSLPHLQSTVLAPLPFIPWSLT